MSYLVLARKYRPRDFDTLVGQCMIRIFGYSPRDLTRFDEAE